MGIFGVGERCPVCNQPVKGISRVRIQGGGALCRDCQARISMSPKILSRQSVEEIEKHFAYRKENHNLFFKFQTANEVSGARYVLREDPVLQKWYYSASKTPENPPLYGYEELNGYTLLQNGKPLPQKDEKKTKTVKSLQLRIHLNNPYHEQITIDFFPYFHEDIQEDSSTYRYYREQAQAAIDFLEGILSKAKKAESANASFADSSKKIGERDAVEEIRRYRALLEEGAIDEAEFAFIKRKLLGMDAE